MPKHTCHLCGQIAFNTYHEYETHRADMHALKSEIKPENVTGRTPRQIVADAEAGWLKPYVVPTDTLLTVTSSNENQHLDACRCTRCFNKKLDLLIESQEAVLQEMITE